MVGESEQKKKIYLENSKLKKAEVAMLLLHTIDY